MSTHELTCMFREIEFRRSDSLSRHYLAAHQLIWRSGRLTGATDSELAERLVVLRRRQMSSRRRRRLRATRQLDNRGAEKEESFGLRVASISCAETWENDAPPLDQFSLPDLPELAAVPQFNNTEDGQHNAQMGSTSVRQDNGT